MLRPVLFHPRAKAEIRVLPKEARVRLGSALMALQRGFGLGMPISRPMPMVGAGVAELRLRNAAGQYRVFYVSRSEAGILVLRAFQKKSRATPKQEIDLARQRLAEMLDAQEEARDRA